MSGFGLTYELAIPEPSEPPEDDDGDEGQSL